VSEGPTAVIGAMDAEIATLLPNLHERRTVRYGPFDVHEGTLDGHPTLLAVCGVGKANAAALAQQLLALGARRVVFTGVAGALDPDLAVGDVVVARDAVQHDVDVTGLGYAAGEVPGEPVAWPADAALRDAAFAAAEAAVAGEATVRIGRVASGDTFVAGAEAGAAIRTAFDAACAEMEGAAVAQVCHRWGVPWVVVRSISDTADHAAETDFRAFTERAAARAERVVRGLLARLDVGAGEVA